MKKIITFLLILATFLSTSNVYSQDKVYFGELPEIYTLYKIYLESDYIKIFYNTAKVMEL